MSRDSILFVLPTLKQAGAETQACDLAIALSKQVDCSLVTLSHDTNLAHRLDEEKVDWCAIPRKGRFDITVVGKLAQYISQGNYTAIHCTNQFTYLLVWLACRRCEYSGQVVAALHTTKNVSLIEEVKDRLIYVPLLRKADSCVFVCETQMQYWLKKYPSLQHNSQFIHNGVDIAHFDDEADFTDFQQPFQQDKGSLKVACIAAFRPEKRHDLLLRAFSKLPKHVTLMLAGGGPLQEEIERHIDDLGLSDRVRMLGQLPDVRPLLSEVDLTILTSTAVETFSIAMLESMSMGVPMLSPDIGGAKEAIEHDVNGFIYPPGDEQALVTILTKLANDPGKLTAMGLAAKIRVRAMFTKEIMVDQYKKLLSEQ